jgi:hypothetical protein
MLPLPSTDTNCALRSSEHFALSISVYSRARLRSAGCFWWTPLDASQLNRLEVFPSRRSFIDTNFPSGVKVSKKQPEAAQQGYSTIHFLRNYFLVLFSAFFD